MKQDSKFRKKRWYVYHVNCDCASYYTTRSKHPSDHFPRCDYCRRQLSLDFRFLASVSATTQSEAIKLGIAKAKENL